MGPTDTQIGQFRTLVTELAQLCAEQRRAAEASGETWLVEDAGMAVRNLDILDKQISDHSLPPSKGMSLGLAKAIGEWGIEKLYDQAGRVDDYYARIWNW